MVTAVGTWDIVALRGLTLVVTEPGAAYETTFCQYRYPDEIVRTYASAETSSRFDNESVRLENPLAEHMPYLFGDQ